MSVTIGYCTNVHAGVDLPAIRDNLQRHATDVHRLMTGDEPLGVGLWLPEKAARELAGSGPSGSHSLSDFRQFLDQRHLQAFTINGFPYDNFHDPIVKHRVYEPAWWDPRRLNYTKQLATILLGLMPPTQRIGSISTLPIGWLDDLVTTEQMNRAGENLRELAAFLARIESRSGRQIVVAIEPEPGCILDTAEDVLGWFERELPDAAHRRHLTVCHDVCHSAVMMESQAEVLRKYAAAGITIGKVQVSSAVVADWDSMAIGRRQETAEQLAGFAEDRYLHQTGRLLEDGSFRLAEDLPNLLDQIPRSGDPAGGDRRWVVHFHVPIFLERFGRLSTSQAEIRHCLLALQRPTSELEPRIEFTGHYEVETYAWTVLPEAMRKRELADDIAAELRWLQKELIDCS
ncbi:metabolite traffic protein EboE [Novipirellula artificiosorum]|uniref:Xylose isomerase-like TIM barrel n=1 Tax=Novipirellula artificiosorum TaxID=2528016 RepID=A0A5C6DP44_9BACT|nr:metabolite traffic protein EboE [Novipirellula artificiosorum]TWU38498.1 Xylose isomerase-like TIM barrel [Novipirellula artificiosorum]